MLLGGQELPGGCHNRRTSLLEKAPGQPLERNGQSLGIAQAMKRASSVSINSLFPAHLFRTERFPEKLHQSAQLLEMLSRLVHGIAGTAPIQRS